MCTAEGSQSLGAGAWSMKRRTGGGAFTNGKGAVAIPIANWCQFIR